MRHYNVNDGTPSMARLACGVAPFGNWTRDLHAVNCENCIRTIAYCNRAVSAREAQYQALKALEAQVDQAQALLTLLNATVNEAAKDRCDWAALALARRQYLAVIEPIEVAAQR